MDEPARNERGTLLPSPFHQTSEGPPYELAQTLLLRAMAHLGTVRRWKSDRGFGFIRPATGGPDIFCHVTSLLHGEGSVRVGDEVEYHVMVDPGKNKDCAVNVQPASGRRGRGRERAPSPSRGRERAHSRSGGRGFEHDGHYRGHDADHQRQNAAPEAAEPAIGEPPHGRCVFLTCGWAELGGRWLRDSFPFVRAERLWHRMDLIFNKNEHLCARGTSRAAQDHLAQLYPDSLPDAVKCAIELALAGLPHGKLAHVFVCKHGHHRSVAFAELVARQLRNLYPDIVVQLYHLDHRESWSESLLGGKELNREENDFEDNIEAPYVNANAHPPTDLLHNRVRF